MYSPIEDWDTDEVWMFLMQYANPWGVSNKDLLTMYQGASADSECPLVVDSTTPSCGDSRFGCWTCTLVEQDKSMAAMVHNSAEHKWMKPLLDLRNNLDNPDDKEDREYRKMNGTIQLFKDKIVHGPYTQKAREKWLRELLKAQTKVRKRAPEGLRNIELISMDELHEVRRIWIFEKHEVEDILPKIYEDETGEKFPGKPLDAYLTLGADEMELLRELCEDDDTHFTTMRELLSVERRYRTMSRRSGLFEALEKVVRKGYFADADDALDYARNRDRLRMENRDRPQLRAEAQQLLPLMEVNADASA
ncbi:hypothetical protein O3I_003960 [Nocardia brasiliensis ATCC 700358]|uniref:Sulfurtransferase DndC n=1 Tax=Nocardia brasiliensis (strain ATCC 700358 / HUJEG-1) TaxID=1133849 RepID=K0EPK0_NOCB7|nr:hypothetical protein O3I_003960 [Nocardia brasiliensis ATCC 700358]